MRTFWVEFVDGTAGSVQAKDADTAREIAERETGGKGAVSAAELPYPAEPQIHNENGCPPFCYSPSQCKGHTSCPHRYACSE